MHATAFAVSSRTGAPDERVPARLDPIGPPEALGCRPDPPRGPCRAGVLKECQSTVWRSEVCQSRVSWVGSGAAGSGAGILRGIPARVGPMPYSSASSWTCRVIRRWYHFGA